MDWTADDREIVDRIQLAPSMVSVIYLFLLARKDTLVGCEATPHLSPSHKIGFRLALDRAKSLKIRVKMAPSMGRSLDSSMNHYLLVGYSKNQAVNQSSGNYLCFQDVDDLMLPDRISEQFQAAEKHPNAIIGSNFERLPKDSTVRFTRWANSLKEEQLYRQIYTSHGPTLIMPTWFCDRKVFERVGGFNESGKGTPEDLIFFYRHLDHDGQLFKVPRCLLVYRYHPGATTFSIDEKTIWNIRIKRLQEKVLIDWLSFTIWNAGKQGRHFYKSLEPLFQEKVAAFCDVDVKKVGKYYAPYEKGAKNYPKIPIIHFKDSTPPLIICVKLVRTNKISFVTGTKH
uniref:Glycosyltransferase 2-like domain-containing protein n=1 Tax=Timema cristinae TaxID=61476 RepID=A0A7R9CPR0_TIMCR|nr:unnamed protein product [Timema cristinae]